MASSTILNLLMPLYLSQFSSDSHKILYVGSSQSQEKYCKVRTELECNIQDGGVRHLEFTCAVVSPKILYVANLLGLEMYHGVEIGLGVEIQDGGVSHFELTCSTVSHSIFIGFS
jgi:hypothetical protein